MVVVPRLVWGVVVVNLVVLVVEVVVVPRLVWGVVVVLVVVLVVDALHERVVFLTT